MLRKQFNEDWTVSSNAGGSLVEAFLNGKKEEKKVTLPHDAMVEEERTPDTRNGSQTGFYPGGLYHYGKKFFVPEEWENETVILELEGAYMNARVYVNGDYAGGYPHGYSNFYVCLDHFLKYGQENELKVIVNNGMELNSRWYSGSGLYRNVNLLTGKRLHIQTDGLRITTPEIDENTAVVAVETRLVNEEKCNRKICLITEIRDAQGNIAASDTAHATVFGGTEITVRQRMAVAHPLLWDCDTPNLYHCAVRVVQEETVWDEAEDHFGIRKLSLDAVNGLRINGREVKLRGSCIHHDNGIIGACTLERAEERRCEIMKEAGFNCIRSSHHPMSRAMLDACDRLGMLVMDELSDMWTRSKNNNDYSMNFQDYWEKDVELLVAKDYNHPSVILYSMGNEIQEAGTAKGAELNRKINEKIKSLDNTRYTTNAINGMLAVMDSMGQIMSDILGKTPEEMMAEAAKAAQQAQNEGQEAEKEGAGQNEGGSDGLNSMMGMMVGPMADAMASHRIMTEKTDEFVDAMDIAGYNYMTGRHEMEHQIRPNRIVLGTETFPADIVRLWSIVKNNKHVIGDMTWTGYDYLGEAGIGIFYYDGTVNFSSHWPDRVAYIGDINLIGYRRPISYLREIVYGLRKNPYIAVERPEHYGEKCGKTPWMWKNNIASWTWKGQEGNPVSIDVYSDADEVELFLNGKSLGRKAAGEGAGFMAAFETAYEPGELKAVSYVDGEISGTHILETAAEEVSLCVEADRRSLKADGADLSFLTVSLRDKDGRENLQAVKEVTVQVEGAGTLQGFGSADPQALGSYQDTTWKTYDGYVMAAVRAGRRPGAVKVTFTAEGCEPAVVELEVK